MGVLMSMFMYAQQLGDDRRANPGDDIASVLMHAEVDGERLTAQEFGSFFILLVVAGNETTRNAIAHGMKLLTDHPDQRTIWFDDYDGHLKTAVDEIVRCATPVIHFRRTVTEDTVINNTKVEAGQKVVLWYNSANRDETVFAERRLASTSPGRCSRSRSASAPAGRTSASAPTSPAARSR